MSAVEANFDGLVGPTHNYAGLSFGNVASQKNADQASQPRTAVLQGLAKMRALANLGLAQGVLPPQERPHLPTLRSLGFTGKDAEILAKARKQAPQLLAAASSASAMWTANAATVSPSADCADGKVHFTPANLCTNLHRAIEYPTTARALQSVFANTQHFVHHPALPGTPALGDEGAANHTRLCSDYGEPGLELFVYGKGPEADAPQRYPARQTRAAGEAIARLHGLDDARTHHALQNPAVVDAGVFHNDVIAVGNRELLLYHAQAFADESALRGWITRQWRGTRAAVLARVEEHELSVAEAVTTYLFNSQLVCVPEGGMQLVLAQECREHPRAWAVVQRLIADERNPISGAQVFDLRQSMRNGGGPACLRLRVVLTDAERAAVNPKVWMTPELHAQLQNWARQHYRESLKPEELADPRLLDESRTALDRLTQILGLGSLYDFQR